MKSKVYLLSCIDWWVKNEHPTSKLPGGRWVIAKPLNYRKGYYNLKDRLYGCLQILRCKAVPIKFEDD